MAQATLAKQPQTGMEHLVGKALPHSTHLGSSCVLAPVLGAEAIVEPGQGQLALKASRVPGPG